MRTVARASLAAAVLLSAAAVGAQPVFINNGAPDGRLATASNPAIPGGAERETADDFFLTHATALSGATFFGLLPGGLTPADINSLTVELYRIFPLDSDVGRTSGSPPFSTPQVPARVNSPSDVDFLDRALGAGLTFTATSLGPFSVLNSVVTGIHPLPGVTTGGEGPVTGTEISLDVTFTDPIDLPAGHYFIVPQVGLTSDTFLWLSAATPTLPDLQTWIRDENLAPDWLRVGTDVIGAGRFNAAFTLSGTTIPEPSTIALVAGGLALLGWAGRRRRRDVE